jgi:hypothetical protein
MVEEKKNKRWRRRKTKGGKFLKSKGRVGQWKEKNNPPHCFVRFRLIDLGSSQNGQNSLIHNWWISGCWVTAAPYLWLIIGTSLSNIYLFMKRDSTVSKFQQLRNKYAKYWLSCEFVILTQWLGQ